MSGVLDPNNPCLQELTILKNIEELLKTLNNVNTEISTYSHGVWTAYRHGKSVTYVYQFVYAGATMTIDLDFYKHVQVNRVVQIWNDTTAKDFDLRTYDQASSPYYASINTQTAHVSTSAVNQLGTEWKYPIGSRLQLYYSNFTVGKICKITVQVDEL